MNCNKLTTSMDLCNNTIATLACNKEDKVNSLAPIMTCVLLMASLTSVTVKRNLKEKKNFIFIALYFFEHSSRQFNFVPLSQPIAYKWLFSQREILYSSYLRTVRAGSS